MTKLDVSWHGSLAQWSEYLQRKWKVLGLNPHCANNFPSNVGNCCHGSKRVGLNSLTAGSHLEDFALSAVEEWLVCSTQPRLSNENSIQLTF